MHSALCDNNYSQSVDHQFVLRTKFRVILVILVVPGYFKNFKGSSFKQNKQIKFCFKIDILTLSKLKVFMKIIILFSIKSTSVVKIHLRKLIFVVTFIQFAYTFNLSEEFSRQIFFPLIWANYP